MYTIPKFENAGVQTVEFTKVKIGHFSLKSGQRIMLSINGVFFT